MVFTDVTQQLRYMIEEKRKELPSNKRRRLNRPSSHVPGEARDGGETPFMETYMREAHSILSHIGTLSRMLAAVRRPYLDVHARPPPAARQTSRAADAQSSEDFDRVWADVKYLNNDERDQIDIQARTILARCAERVKSMEALEKRRSELATKDTSPLLRILPARLRHDATTAATDFVAAHNASVTWYLTRRLAEASQSMRDMQEERVRRQMERSASLGAGAGREAAHIMASTQPASSGGWLGGAPSLASSWIAPSMNPEVPPETYDLTDDDDDDLELSASQIQQFEAENAQILRAAEDTLAAVQQAESRLLEIAALQSELVSQLTRQSEITDQLFEDAVASSEYVERGNVQLREARRRAKDSRMWILLFLIGASLSLLFLHYY